MPHSRALLANTVYSCETSPTRGQGYYSESLAQRANLTHPGIKDTGQTRIVRVWLVFMLLRKIIIFFWSG